MPPTGKKTTAKPDEATQPEAPPVHEPTPEELVQAAAEVATQGQPTVIDSETFMRGIEMLVEKLAGQQGREVQLGRNALSGTPDDIANALAGTIVIPDPAPEDELEEWVVFRSKGVPYTVVRKPRFRGTSPTGEQYFTTGISYVFETGEFRTRDRSVVNYLHSRPGWNLDFWQVGNEPNRPPSPELIMARILKATVELDDETLQGLHAQEMATHKRDIVLNSITEARRQVQRPEMAPQT